MPGNIIPIDRGGVRGFLHRSEGADNGVVLTHGAGGTCDASLLVRAAEAFGAAGWCVLRCDLPFRQRRPRGPPSPATATADRVGLREAVELMRELLSGWVLLGGHSYGGRQATMLAAEEPELATALLLFSYPLHPPGKPERARTGHFPRLRRPAVFVHGTADAFGSIDELRSAVSLIAAPTQIVAIEGVRHDLKGGRFNLAPVIAAVSGMARACASRETP